MTTTGAQQEAAMAAPAPAASPAEPPAEPVAFNAAELGALAHLYRGEVYRSTLWRARLDQTTNWSVVTTGLALSLTFAGPFASPLPLILVGLLVVVFLIFEARRYRYFNVWRARCRLMETYMYAPLLRGQGITMDGRWNRLLADDYAHPRFTSAISGRWAGGCGATTPISSRCRRWPISASSPSIPARRIRCGSSSSAPRSGRSPAGWSCWPASPST